MSPVKQAEIVAIIAGAYGETIPDWAWDVLDATDDAAGGLEAGVLAYLLTGTSAWRTHTG